MTNKKKSKLPFSISALESITYITKAIALRDIFLDEALEKILQLAKNITNADFGSVHLYIDDADKLVLAARSLGDVSQSQLEGISIDAGKESIGYVAKTKRPVVIHDISKNDNNYINFFKDALSELAVPIFSGEDFIGVLNIESRNKNNFDEESIKIIELLTSLLGTAAKIALDEVRVWKELTTTNKSLAFVLMPFREPFNKYYRTIIRPAIEDTNLVSLRVDEIFGPTNISKDIWDSINRAKVVIAELTTRNPNVMYELGLSHGVGKPVIMISQSIDDVPFDLRHLRCILYDTTDPEWALLLRKNITEAIDSVLEGKGENSPYKMNLAK